MPEKYANKLQSEGKYNKVHTVALKFGRDLAVLIF